MPDQNTNPKFSLARNLAIWIGIFFLISAILILSWSSWLHRKESLASFHDLATSNAAFVEDLRYPLSPQLTSQLSDILDLQVGFYLKKSITGNIPPSLHKSIFEMAQNGESTCLVEGKEIALAPFQQAGHFLILIRDQDSSFRIFGISALLPALVLAIGCAALAFALGLNIVKPLRALTKWLPNLQVEEELQSEHELPQHVLQRKDEIGLLAQTLVETRDSLNREKELRALSERLAALGRIATSLAHEVKNPAAAIRMHADLISESASGETLESVNLIKEEVDQISDLVNQWLFVAKSRPSKVETHDLNALVSSVCERLKGQAEFAAVDLTVASSAQPIWIDVDARRWEQVIRNLVLNSIQAMPSGGKVELKTGIDCGFAKLTVHDSGPGFSDEALRRFGEPFFSEKEGGMGIGLTLSKEVSEAHGGSLTAENPKGKPGAIVSLTIPQSTTKKNQ